MTEPMHDDVEALQWPLAPDGWRLEPAVDGTPATLLLTLDGFDIVHVPLPAEVLADLAPAISETAAAAGVPVPGESTSGGLHGWRLGLLLVLVGVCVLMLALSAVRTA